MGYLQEMRKLVGHRTMMQTAASVIVINEQDQILLEKRTDNHLWGYAGGSVEIDERVEDCAKRELLEETGLIAEDLQLFMINSGPEVHYVYPNGDEVSNVEIVYLFNRFHGILKCQNGETEELRFVHPDQIDLNEISPPIRPVLKRYISTWRNQRV